MTPAERWSAAAEALRADVAGGRDLTGWRRRFSGDGFTAMLERVHADPAGAAPAVLAFLAFVRVYVEGCVERGPPVPKRHVIRRRMR